NCLKLAGQDLPHGLVENDLNNFAPRLGLAFRPLKDSTVIRASGGIFYDNDMRTNSETIVNPPFFSNESYSGLALPSLSLSNPFPGGGAAALSPLTLDSHYRDTYVEQWNLNVQHEVAPGLLAEVGYIGNHMVKARRLRNVNQAVNAVRP